MDSYIIFLSDWDDYATIFKTTNDLTDNSQNYNMLLTNNFYLFLLLVFMFGMICSMIMCSCRKNNLIEDRSPRKSKNFFSIVDV